MENTEAFPQPTWDDFLAVQLQTGNFYRKEPDVGYQVKYVIPSSIFCLKMEIDIEEKDGLSRKKIELEAVHPEAHFAQRFGVISDNLYPPQDAAEKRHNKTPDGKSFLVNSRGWRSNELRTLMMTASDDEDRWEPVETAKMHRGKFQWETVQREVCKDSMGTLHRYTVLQGKERGKVWTEYNPGKVLYVKFPTPDGRCAEFEISPTYGVIIKAGANLTNTNKRVVPYRRGSTFYGISGFELISFN